MRQTTKGHDTEMRVQSAMQETVVKTETQKEIERMKAEIAILLARMDHQQAHLAAAETTERAI